MMASGVRRNITLVAMVIIGLVATSLPTGAADPKSYGKGVALTQATPLKDVLASPSKYEGKTVRVEGYVTAVCEEMGCWLALAPSQTQGDPTLLIQVEHGVVIFPMSAKGSRAAAEGVLQRAGSHESHSATDEHAKHEGKSASEASQWQLKTTGALIY